MTDDAWDMFTRRPSNVFDDAAAAGKSDDIVVGPMAKNANRPAIVNAYKTRRHLRGDHDTLAHMIVDLAIMTRLCTEVDVQRVVIDHTTTLSNSSVLNCLPVVIFLYMAILEAVGVRVDVDEFWNYASNRRRSTTAFGAIGLTFTKVTPVFGGPVTHFDRHFQPNRVISRRILQWAVNCDAPVIPDALADGFETTTRHFTFCKQSSVRTSGAVAVETMDTGFCRVRRLVNGSTHAEWAELDQFEAAAVESLMIDILGLVDGKVISHGRPVGERRGVRTIVDTGTQAFAWGLPSAPDSVWKSPE